MSASAIERITTGLWALWAAIQDRHPDVPPAVVTVAAGAKASTSRWTGAAGAIEGQVTIAVQAGDTAETVAAGVLHQAAHGIARWRGTKDTSREGRYHNGAFRALAETVGLSASTTSTTGWSATTIEPATADSYRPQLLALAEALADMPAPDPKPPARNLAPAVCSCGRGIRVARSVLAAAPITCGRCGEPFELTA